MPKATPEDLINTVIKADDLRRKALGRSSTRAAQSLGQSGPSSERLFIEPFFNVLGLLWGQAMLAMPFPFRRRFIQWINGKMGAYSPAKNAELPLRIRQTLELAHDVYQKTGQWPALLILTSHPDTEGPHQWLRFELVRLGLQIADAYVDLLKPGAWFPPAPKCFLAIDPYALDTVSTPVGAFYGAWMHRIFLAWDRQSSTQSWIQKYLLLRHTGYDRIFWRLLKTLKNNQPVVMVASGGLPYNARLLYAAREFVQRLPIQRWTLSKRQAQIDLLTILMTPEDGVWPPGEGKIPDRKEKEIVAALASWGLPSNQQGPALEELRAEFRRPVPERARLMHVLQSRLVGKKKPLLLVRIHHTKDPLGVEIPTPILQTPSSSTI